MLPKVWPACFRAAPAAYLAVSIACVLQPQSKEGALMPVRTVAVVSASGILERGTRVVQDSIAWRETWEVISGSPNERRPVIYARPEIDFSTESVVVVSAGFGSSGAPELSFRGYRMSGDTVAVVVDWKMPAVGCAVAADVTYLTVVGAIPRPNVPVRIETERSTFGC